MMGLVENKGKQLPWAEGSGCALLETSSTDTPSARSILHRRSQTSISCHPDSRFEPPSTPESTSLHPWRQSR